MLHYAQEVNGAVLGTMIRNGQVTDRNTDMDNKDKPVYHIPVLLQEAIDALNIKPDGMYVDCTFGGGGHSRRILKRLMLITC